MKTQCLICLALALLFVNVFEVSAQKTGISNKDLVSYFQRSQKATGDGPFRNRTVIETGETHDGPWKPYSSWIYQVILPDRSHLQYTSGRVGEFIHIGERSFSMAANGGWTESKDTISGSTSSPSNPFRAFRGPVVVYTEDREGDMLRVTVTSKPSAEAEPSHTKTLTHMYYFDSTGVLKREQSIGYNGSKWVRRTETFEYDPNIRIVAPID